MLVSRRVPITGVGLSPVLYSPPGWVHVDRQTILAADFGSWTFDLVLFATQQFGQ